MYTNSNEEKEYNEFMTKVIQKARETQNDFNKLSDNNKLKVKTAINQIIQVQGFSGLMNYLNNWK